MKKLIISSLALLFVLFVIGGPAFAAYDMDGETITIKYPLDVPEYYTDGPGVDRVERVEQEYNTNIEFVYGPWQDFEEEVMSGVLAGDVPADAYVMQVPWMENLAAEGYLYPLDTAVDMVEYYEERVPEINNFYADVTFGPNIYGLPLVSDADPYTTSHIMGLAWNKSEFERLGLTSLYELEAAGEWNYETFMDKVAVLTQDKSDDGEIDYWGYGEYIDIIDPTFFVHANGGTLFREEDGQIVFAYDDPEAMEALELYYDLAENGYIGPDDPDEAAMFTQESHNFVNVTEHEDEWGWITYPTGEYGPERGMAPVWLNYTMVFPATIDGERAEAQIEIMSDLYQMTTDYLAMSEDEYEQEMLDEWAYSQNIADRESIEYFTHMLYNRNILNKHNYLADYELFGLVWLIANAELTPSESIAELGPAVQGGIDDLFEDIGRWAVEID